MVDSGAQRDQLQSMSPFASAMIDSDCPLISSATPLAAGYLYYGYALRPGPN
jgi:hypothetical protein